MPRDKRLAWALGLNLVIVVVQVIFGISAHSLGLLADAGHNLTDVAAIALSLLAVRLLLRGPSAKRSYGYHRSGVLAAQANAATILMATALITYEGIRRLLHPSAVDGLIVIIVAAIALGANALSAWLLNDRSHDVNMRSALLHMVGDAGASAGVVVAGLVIYLTGRFYWLDPLVSIGIGLIIAWRAVRLLAETTGVLMESTPAGLELSELVSAVEAAAGVEAVHDVHAWSLSSELHALSAHVVLDGHPSLEEAQLVGVQLKQLLTDRFDIEHATLELECEPCISPDELDCAVAQPPAATVGRHHGHPH